MYDAADILHGRTDPALAAISTMAGFKTSDNSTAVAASLALTTSGFTTFYSGNSKQLGRQPSYRTIQGFQSELVKVWDFKGDWVWDFTVSNGGAPGVAGANDTGVISSSATVGDLSVFLQYAEDVAFTNPVDMDGFDIPLGAWVGSASFASGLAAGQYTKVTRPIPKIPQPGVSVSPTWSASAIPSLKLLYDAARTYGANDVVWYNGVIYKSKVGANAGNLPNAAGSTFWGVSVWLPQYLRIKFVVSNGATASNLTFFLPTVAIRPARQ